MKRWVALPLVVLLATTLAHRAGSVEKQTVVAVLDTGIRATHETFSSTQITAWYDFALSGGPSEPTTKWDPRVNPFDDNGHGTKVAGMVGGSSSLQTLSHAPGVKLAIAKISAPDGSASWLNVARAIRWATHVAGADVISLSFYAYLPQLGMNHPLLEALRVARAEGALPVVLAGNGLENFGLIPSESWLQPPATSLDSLVVGGAGEDGRPQAPLGGMDPEVTALYSVIAPSFSCDACYSSVFGTSFSTPLVAGMAAKLIEAGRTASKPVAPDTIELLLKRAAFDQPGYPPNLEGYGFLNASRLQIALEAQATNTSPARSVDGELSALYVENVQNAERMAWSGRV